MTFPKRISGQVDFPARTSAQQANERALQASDPVLRSPSLTLWSNDDLGGLCWKMSQDSSLPTKALISDGLSMRWTNSGMAWRGELWTLNISESPSVAVESSLSEVLNATAPPRFSLSAKAASGILRRVKKRQKTLPSELIEALEIIAAGNQQMAQMRRLTPTECERLMGYPDGWTIASSVSHRDTADSQPNSTIKRIR